MRRNPYNQKSSNHNYKNYQANKSKLQLDFDAVGHRLEMNKFNYDNFIPSSKATRYSYNQKNQSGIKIPDYSSNKRPYTTQRSNSFHQIKKQDKFIESVKHNSSYSKNNQQSKDLWISTVRDMGRKQFQRNFSNKFHDASFNKGRLYRGISLKGDEKSFLKDQSFDVKNRSNYTSNNTLRQSIQSPTKSHKPTIIDLIGKNLKKSMAANNNANENFFEYVMRFAYKTKKGYSQSNPGKINQDSYITSPNINNKSWEHLFGICDGHGPLGHLVSNFIKNSLPQSISNIKNIQKNPIYNLNKGFSNAYEKLIKQSHIDMSFSGSTVITCYFIQNKLYCCNVGDSRAILGRSSCQKKWKTIALSTDHKPQVQSQAQRIIKQKGRVQAYRDEFGQQMGPLRVWLRNDNVPGLAMTRSFGDLVGASVGVSSQPQIKQFTLTQDDKIILIASDGVFQFLENEQIINELIPFYEKKQTQQATDHLLALAHSSWTRRSSVVDDITFILIFLHYGEI